MVGLANILHTAAKVIPPVFVGLQPGPFLKNSPEIIQILYFVIQTLLKLCGGVIDLLRRGRPFVRYTVHSLHLFLLEAIQLPRLQESQCVGKKRIIVDAGGNPPAPKKLCLHCQDFRWSRRGCSLCAELFAYYVKEAHERRFRGDLSLGQPLAHLIQSSRCELLERPVLYSAESRAQLRFQSVLY